LATPDLGEVAERVGQEGCQLLVGLDGTILWTTSPAAAAWTGLAAGADAADVLAVDPEATRAVLRTAIRSSSPVPAHLAAADGSRLKVVVSRAAAGMVLMRLPERGPRDGGGDAFADLTRRLDQVSERDRRRLQQLRLDEQLHRWVVDTTSDGLIVFDEAGAVIAANPAACQIFGAPRADLLGRRGDDPGWGYLDTRGAPLPPRDQPAAGGPGGAAGSRLLGVRRRQGDHRWVRVTAQPLDNPSGVPGVLVALNDITGARTAAIEREEAQALARIGSFTFHSAGGDFQASTELLRLLEHLPQDGELTLDAFVDRIHVDDRPSVRHALDSILAGGPSVQLTLGLRLGDGDELLVRLRARGDGPLGAMRVLGTLQDVTEESLRERRLREAESRFRLAFENAPIGMALVALDGRWMRVNRALVDMLGYDEQTLLTKTFQDITHPDDLDGDLEHVRSLLGGQASSYTMEKRYVTAAGELLWVLLSGSMVRDELGRPVHFIAQIVDISPQKATEERLHRLADHDSLTGLVNRRRFEELLDLQLARGRGDGQGGTLVMFDLDRFKYVNDTLGHKAGDDLIRHVAGLVTTHLRETDVVARLGGDEFAVLLPGVTSDAARRIADALCHLVSETPLMIEGQPVFTSMSAGLTALSPGSPGAGEGALVAADVAMYEAKQRGRNRVVGYDEAGIEHQRLNDGLAWSQRLRRAIEEERLVLHAQPVRDLRTGDVRFHELLVRLVEEDGSLIQPGAFLPSAERFGLLRALDRWVVRAAADTARRHPALTFSVNLSGMSMTDDTMAAFVRMALESAGCRPDQLIVEVTETEAIANTESAARLATELQTLGCRVALDDFGAGFATFQRLKTLPVDIVKLDGGFVRTLGDDGVDAVVVSAVRDLAAGLDLELVAEHVEDEAVLRRLRALGVRQGQGFHLGRPAALRELSGRP